MRWFVYGIVAASVLLVLAVLYYGEAERPRFYDVEPRPGLVCLFDRVQNEVVPGTCREIQQ